MDINEAIKIYNHKLVIIGALFLDYNYVGVSVSKKLGKELKIEDGMMYFNSRNTFKKLVSGFGR